MFIINHYLISITNFHIRDKCIHDKVFDEQWSSIQLVGSILMDAFEMHIYTHTSKVYIPKK